PEVTSGKRKSGALKPNSICVVGVKAISFFFKVTHIRKVNPSTSSGTELKIKNEK
ncbi:MAG: hypothetical protein ACI8YO_001327, partial [Gammaproteobacteria bacterium]